MTQNPVNLGLGIDEDTAVIVRGNRTFQVLGSGAVYVVDGTGITYSSLSEENAKGVFSMFDIKLHVLGNRQRFDLASRRPIIASAASS